MLSNGFFIVTILHYSLTHIHFNFILKQSFNFVHFIRNIFRLSVAITVYADVVSFQNVKYEISRMPIRTIAIAQQHLLILK